jgi:hypothetical protein
VITEPHLKRVSKDDPDVKPSKKTSVYITLERNNGNTMNKVEMRSQQQMQQ